jgi:hypothetical protein
VKRFSFTVLPLSLPIRNIQQEFKASNYIVRTSRKLVAGKGILPSPNIKPGKVLPSASAEMVKLCYVFDEISRIMPGTKDYVSVCSQDKKVYLQKRLILCNLKETYLNFKEQNLENFLGFSKFAQL